MKRFIAALIALLPTCVFAQVTPNLQLNIPPQSSSGWAPKINANFTSLDQYLSGAKPLPSITLSGAITNSTQAATKAYVDAAVVGGCGLCITALTGDVVASGSGSTGATVHGLNGVLLTSLSTGLLKITAGIPSIGVAGTDFLLPSRNLSDLPSASTARTNLGLGTAATQATSAFDAAGAAAAAQSAAQSFASNASNLTSGTIPSGRVPVLNQNTTGNAATASALAATPSLCSAGQAAGGILPSGNATQCFTPSGGSGSMVYPSGSGLAVVAAGTAWGTTITPPSGALVGTSDIQTLTNKTVDGITPSIFAFVDPTSSIQTQFNGKQASLGFTAVPNTTTVNGHALSTNVTVSASDLTTGTLPHAQLPTLLSADIPTNTANTAGLSAGVSGSQSANTVYAAPNGTSGVLTPRPLVAADIPALSYQLPLTLTTTGSSGPATLIGSTLNVPSYSPGGSMVYPGGSGIPIVAGGVSWATTLAAPTGAVVGTTDTQTLTNKSIAATQLTGSSLPGTISTAGGLTTVAGGTFGTAAFTTSSAYDAAGAAASAQTNAEAAFTGDVVKTAGSFATTVARINGTALAGLATGLLKNTITTGIPSIATAGVDYQAPLSLTTTGTSGTATLSGNILNVPNYTLPTATTSTLGGVKVDGTTITIASGVISATSGGSGTVTSVSSGNLSPLFTTSVATSTSTPSLSFALSNAAQNSVLAGPATGGAGSPSYQTAPTISAANMTSFPTLNQSTTGTAAGLGSGAVGSLPYQSAASTTAFIASPTTTGHTFVPAWQPSGSAIAPTSLDLATYLSSPPSIGSVTPGSGAFTTLSSTGAISIGSSAPAACGSATGCLGLNEASTAGTPTAGQDYIRADSSSHSLKASVNGGAEFSLGSGGSMVYPGSGIGVSTGTAWGTSLTPPTGTIVGTSDTQTLTNKSIAGSEVNSGTVAAAQMPALTGDATAAAGTAATTVVKVNGVSYPASPATHTQPVVTASNTVSYASTNRSIGWSFGDVATGSALTTSEVGYLTVPFACTIVGWHIMVDSGTATIKVARVNGGTALPTIGSNSISTSGVAISTGTKVDSTTVTDFTSTAVAQNDTLGIFLTAVSGPKQLTYQIDCAQ